MAVALGLAATSARAFNLPNSAEASFEQAIRRGDLEGGLQALDDAADHAKAQGISLRIADDSLVAALWRALRSRPADLDRLMGDLDRGDWSPSNPVQDPSAIWRDYCARLLESGHVEEAQRVARRITGAQDLLRMRLDKRFAGIVAAQPERFDIPRTVAAELDRDRGLYSGPGGNANALSAMIEKLRLLGRFDEAMKLSDEALAAPQVLDGQGKDYRNWIEDRRAYILWEIGRFDEAITQEKSAAQQLERGHPNVSQTINLATMLNSGGRPAEALAVLEPLRQGATSPYGYMWIAAEQACAAGVLRRDSLLKAALDYTQAHANENRPARLKALLCANQLSDAAMVFAAWLDDPTDRADALVQLCDFTAMPNTPFGAELDKRFAQMRQDPVVQEAVGRVGHTETVALRGVWKEY